MAGRNQHSRKPVQHTFKLNTFVSPETFALVQERAKAMNLPLEGAVRVLIRRGLGISLLNQEPGTPISDTTIGRSLSKS